MTMPSPGWYDDKHGAIRWWDGADWTEHTESAKPEPDAPTTPVAPAPPAPPAPVESVVSSRRKARRWIWGSALGAVAVVVILVSLGVIRFPIFHSNDSPSDQDEAEATSATWSYYSSVVEGDCQAFVEVTTERFRRAQGMEDCAAFREFSAQTAYAGSDHYGVWVPSIERDGQLIVIETIETYDSDRDPDGNETLWTREYENRWRYTVRLVDGDWLIDSVRRV